MNLLLRKINLLDTRKNTEQLKMEFYSVIIGVILSKDLFGKNHDLKVLLEMFKVSLPLRDYLYDSRTTLIARVIREIESSERETLIYNVNLIREFVFDRDNEETSNDVVDLINKYSRNKKKVTAE